MAYEYVCAMCVNHVCFHVLFAPGGSLNGLFIIISTSFVKHRDATTWIHLQE